MSVLLYLWYFIHRILTILFSTNLLNSAKLLNSPVCFFSVPQNENCLWKEKNSSVWRHYIFYILPMLQHQETAASNCLQWKRNSRASYSLTRWKQMPRSSLGFDSDPEVGKGCQHKKSFCSKNELHSSGPKITQVVFIYTWTEFFYFGYMNSFIIGSIFDF